MVETNIFVCIIVATSKSCTFVRRVLTLWHVCCESNLRTPSGKILRMKFCLPESFDFSCLWLPQRCFSPFWLDLLVRINIPPYAKNPSPTSTSPVSMTPPPNAMVAIPKKSQVKSQLCTPEQLHQRDEFWRIPQKNSMQDWSTQHHNFLMTNGMKNHGLRNQSLIFSHQQWSLSMYFRS